MARAPHRPSRRNARFTLTVRGWGLIIVVILVFVTATSLGSVQLMAAGLLLATIFPLALVVSLWPLAPVRAERVLPVTSLTADDRMHLRVRLTGPGAARVAASDWHDLLPTEVAVDLSLPLESPVRRRLPSGDSVVELGTTVRALRRGLYRLGPVEALLGDPFGVMRLRRHIGGTSEITVLPRPAAHVPFGGLSGQGVDGQAGRVARRGESGLDDPIPRVYRPGDSIRRVNWRASARHGELMVRQEEATPSPSLFVILDVDARHWPTPSGAEGSDAAFEWAVSLAATASIDAAQRGWQPVLCAGGTPLTSRGLDGGVAIAEPALLELARIRPTATPTSISGLYPLVSQRNSLLAILGSLTPAAAAEFATLAASIDSATALFTDDVPADILTILESAGWSCTILPVPEAARGSRLGWHA
ncbi:DUF58 domain-containing protein [Mycetocola saprophilus]|uniref:DUF58 domain-containing protein n=1 Tax=Mycetocola saprophilus TaxID=76636 RepID=UPI0004C23B5E|nr:DUF58 domain-containing protein [Mycetocola saprophilus]